MCVRLIDMIITGYSPKQLGKAAGQLRDVSILIRRTKMTKPRLMWYYQQLASSSVSWCIAIRNGREVVWEEENTADNFYSSWDELRHLHTLKLGFNSSDKPLARFLGVARDGKAVVIAFQSTAAVVLLLLNIVKFYHSICARKFCCRLRPCRLDCI